MVKSKKSCLKQRKKFNEKTKKSSTKSKKSNLKRPQTPFFLFSSKQKEELKKNDHNKKLTAKQLRAMWEKLPENKKKVFIHQYEEEKKKYYKFKTELENKSFKDSDVEKEKTSKKKTTKSKAKTKKKEVDKNNRKACNYGKCDECKKAKDNEEKIKEEECEKEKEPKEEESKKENKEKERSKSNSKFPNTEKEKQKPNQNINVFPLENKGKSQTNKQYTFTVGSRRLKVFGKGGKIVGGVVGAASGAVKAAASGLFAAIPAAAMIGAFGGVHLVNFLSSDCDRIGALHVCLLLGNDIFEYGDEGYVRHKNVGKTSEYNWDDNFEIKGTTKVTPDELDKKIIKSNEWIKDKYDEITHNCHSFVKFCCDIIEPDCTIMSVVLVNTPQCRLFRAW